MPVSRKNKLRPVAAVLLAALLLVSGWLLQKPAARWLGLRSLEVQPIASIAPPIDEPSASLVWDKEEITLKVQYNDRSSFMNNIGGLFTLQHPKVKFEVDAGPESYEWEVYKQWIEQEQPDILQVPLFLFEQLADEGLIQPLDGWIKRDSYPLEQYYEAVIRTIREAGGGTLYGLAPYFNASALYYNKTLFEQANIEPPVDGMTWQEILTLAARFSGEDAEGNPVYGLTTDWDTQPFELIQRMGEAEGLRVASANGLQPSVDSPAWRSIWENALRGYQEGWMSGEKEISFDDRAQINEIYKPDPFLQGRAAMALKSGNYRANILAAEAEAGFSEDWGIVTQPVSTLHPYQASIFSIHTIYAINAKSPRAEAAWALVQFITGPEILKHDEQANRPLLSSSLQSAATTEDAPRGRSVFYKLNVDSSAVIQQTAARNISSPYGQWIQQLKTIGDKEARAAIAGEATIEEAIGNVQSQAIEAAAAIQTAGSEEEGTP